MKKTMSIVALVSLAALTGCTSTTPTVDGAEKVATAEVKKEATNQVVNVVKDKAILYKRDPVENRDSILAASIKVYPTGFGAALNPLDLPRTGGDFDGDTYKFFPVFTKEANEQAKKKFHPRYSKSIWTTVGSINNFPYTIELNAATAIYRATKQ